MHEELMYPGTVSNFAAQSEPNFQPCPSIAINLEHTGTGIVVDDFSQLTTAREGSGNFDNAYDFCFHPEQLLPECNQDHGTQALLIIAFISLLIYVTSLRCSHGT